MALSPEDQRALDYQAQERKRKAFERSQQAKLKAPAEPAQTIRKNWEPLRSS